MMSPCSNVAGYRKERFPSERAARKALARKRRFQHRRYPHVYRCPDCSGYHLTGAEPEERLPR
jgi:hypothetical protein